MNILIVGLGSIAKKHIKALQSLNIETTIYALRSSVNAENVEGINNIYHLEDKAVKYDFAIISNPTHLHYQFIQLLANKKIPLFIEKPVVHTLEKISELISLIDTKAVITYVACNLRFHPCIQYLKNAVEKNVAKINELNVYCGSFLPDWRPGKDFRSVYSANASMGGGVHLDLFHELDYTTWLFGFPSKSNSVLRSVSTLQINACDYANYILEYRSFTANIVLNYYRRKPKRLIEIVFEDDTWTVDLINSTIKNDSGELLFSDVEFTIKDTYVVQLQYFIECLKNNQVPMNSFRHSVENLKICLN